MTEHPPSAEALHVAETFVDTRERWHKLARRIDALIAQRVSAETERCAQIAAAQKTEAALAQHKAIEGEDKACWLWAFDTANLIECAIRAPAERPAPPQQKGGGYVIEDRSGPMTPSKSYSLKWGNSAKGDPNVK